VTPDETEDEDPLLVAALEMIEELRTNPKPVDEVELKRSERELSAYAAGWFTDADSSTISEPRAGDPPDGDGRVIPFR